MSTLGELSVSRLLEKCQERKPNQEHEPYCFELFYRAIVDRDNDAWSAIYSQYYRLIYTWATQCVHAYNGVGDTPLEDLVLDAFATFWQAYKPAKLEVAAELSSVLAYFKSCVVSVVGQAKRKIERSALLTEWNEFNGDVSSLPGPVSSSAQMLGRMAEEELWQAIEQTCQDDKDLIIMRLGIVANLKPRKILDLHPDIFTNVREIYDRRRNLRDRLQRNTDIQMLLGVHG